METLLFLHFLFGHILFKLPEEPCSRHDEPKNDGETLSLFEVHILKPEKSFCVTEKFLDFETMADRLWVTPRTIYRWIERFEGRDDGPLARRLADAPRSGRPNRVAQRLDPLIEQFMDDSPENHGYAATVWTAPLLCQHIKKVHHLDTSQRSVSRALERLELSWKRPRHCLARRSPRWRQAKGGSSAGLPGAHAP